MTASVAGFELILWDLDGTITDPKVGITRGVQHALAQFDIVIDDPDTLTMYIGPPLDVSFARHHDVPEHALEDAIAAYREYYLDIGIHEVALHADVAEIVRSLGTSGRRMAIATSKPGRQAELVLERFGLLEHFAFVGGATMDATRRSKVAVIEHTLRELGAAAEVRSAIVMIGDREHDVLAAKQHGLATIGVRWGYAEEGELEAAGADVIADSADALAAILAV